MRLAVTSYELSLFIHITAAIVGLGATFVESLTYAVAKRLDPRHLPYKHALQLTINLGLALPALVVLLVTGLYQADQVGYDLGSLWLAGTMAIVAALALLVAAYFVPEDRRLMRLAKGDIAAAGGGEVRLSDEYLRRVFREQIMGTIADLLVIAAVFLMVTKPGL